MAQDMVLDIKQPKTPHRTTRKRLTEQDIMAMAELNAKRLNDVQACELLDINYETWRSWKTRAKNEPRYARILSRIKGVKIKNCMDSIEKAGERDWRATREYLSLIEPNEFNDKQQSVAPVQISVFAAMGLNPDDIGSKVYAARQSKAIDVQASSKQLTEGKP